MSFLFHERRFPLLFILFKPDILGKSIAHIRSRASRREQSGMAFFFMLILMNFLLSCIFDI